MSGIKPSVQRTRTRRNIVGAIASATLASSVLIATPAMADDGVEDQIAATLAAVPAEYGVMDDNVALSLSASEGEDVVGIPENPNDGISINSEIWPTLEVSLPFADESSPDGTAVGGSSMAYDNENGSLTVPTAKSGGSAQITTIIQNESAPTSYRYELGNDEDLVLSQLEDGGVLIEDLAGNYRGYVLAPWASDADGVPVATAYEIDGSALVQVVDHNSGTYAYPIVADPWLGVAIFSSITRDTYQSQPRVNLQPSVGGYGLWAGGVAGQVIMNTAGWDEAVTKSAQIKSDLNKDSMRQQFECHALGSPFAGEWNLEKSRPNRTTHWSYGVATHHCNWTTANGV